MAARGKSHSKDQNRIPRVAVLVDTSTSWGRRIVMGIHNYIRKSGRWQLFIEARGMEEHWSVPPGWRGDGVIARIGHPEMAAELKTLRIPVINVSGIELAGADFTRVATDLNASAKLASDHFLNRGFKHFAFFSLSGLSYVATLQEAFVRAVRSARCECAIHTEMPRHGAEMDWNADLAQLGEWLRSLPKPVGVLTWNQSSGREVIFACQVAGLLVPEEVAVLSASDDDLLCEVLHIPMSGIMVAAEQIGHEAARLLHRLMRGGKPPQQPTLFPPLSVVTRQSTDTLAMPDRALVKALSFIRGNVFREIQVNEVAREAGVSRRVLERRFADQLGRTPAEEIRRLHFERAKELLAGTDLPIPDVAAAAGFGSPEYLAYLFRENMQVTPLQYRKQIRSR
jgi:LacI family transcriptional regulator